MNELRLFAVSGIGEITAGDDLSALIAAHSAELADGDILIVSSKAVSKSEGRVFPESSLSPGTFAQKLSRLINSSPAYCELVLQESAQIVRMAPGVVISKTHHGFVLANAGVDASNTGGEGLLIALPVDPDASARRIREGIFSLTGKQVAVIVSDTFGRAWRWGQTNLAIGVSGMSAQEDFRGRVDDNGRPMHKTCIAVADELAAAADLVAGKTGRIPAVVARGYAFEPGEGIAPLLMEEAKNLFK